MTKRTAYGGYGDVAAAFNRVDQEYHSPWVLEELKKRLRTAPENAAVLEIGCGTGNFLRALRAAGFGDLTGIDPDVRMIREAEHSEPGTSGYRIVYYAAPTTDIPFGDTVMDAVIAHYSFEHFGHDETAINEIKRVLKPNGILMTVTWPMSGLSEKRAETIRPFATQKRERPPLEHLTGMGYADLLRQYGFDVHTRRQKTIVRYTVEQARQYVRAAGSLSAVPRKSLSGVYELLDQLCEREADDSGHLYREIDAIVDTARVSA